MSNQDKVFPKKAKNFPLHTDGYAYVPDRSAPQECVDEIFDKGTEISADLKEDWPDLLHPPVHKTWFHRVMASFNDPLAVYFVLDALTHSMRGIYLRPLYVCHYLQQAAPQFYWDPSLVGRIMSGLETTCWRAYVEYQAPGEYIPAEHGDGTALTEDEMRIEIPFAKGRDSKGKYYVLDPRGGDEGLLWLLQARERFYELSKTMLDGEKQGDWTSGRGKALTPVDWYYEVIEEPARDVPEFQRTRTGRPFKKAIPVAGEPVQFNGG